MLPLDLNLQMAMGRYGHKEEKKDVFLLWDMVYIMVNYVENMIGMVTEKKDIFLLWGMV